MYYLLLLICYAVHEMKSQWFGEYSTTATKYDIDKFKGLCQGLNKENVLSKLNGDHLGLAVAFLFFSLELEPIADEMKDMIDQCLRTSYHIQWLDMRCQDRKCGNGRSSCKLRKCSSCKVVRYCSRRCQKRAWNSHKRQCLKLKSMRRERSQRMRSIR